MPDYRFVMLRRRCGLGVCYCLLLCCYGSVHCELLFLHFVTCRLQIRDHKYFLFHKNNNKHCHFFFFLLHSFVCLSEVCQVWNWLLKIWIWIEFGIEKPCAVAFQNENQYSVERKSAFLLICGDPWYHLAVNLHFWKEKSSFWKCGCSSAMFLYFWWTGFDLFFNISSNMRHCLLLESHSGKYYLNRS